MNTDSQIRRPAKDVQREWINSSTLLSPDELAEFKSCAWPDRPYAAPPELSRAEPLSQMVGLGSVSDLVDAYDAPISYRRRSGEAGKVSGKREAMNAYSHGATLYFRRVEQYLPLLDHVIQSFSLEIGMLPELVTTEVFASQGSSGVAMHSDYDLNFQFLLRGSKQWQIAQNESIENQTEMCLPGDIAPFDTFQLEIAHTLPFPPAMPASAETYDMDAGSMLYLPCGWWHETRAVGECFAVNIVCKGPRIADVFTKGLAIHLLRDPRWRRYAHECLDLNSSDPEASAEFVCMVSETTAHLDTLTARQLTRSIRDEFLRSVRQKK